MIKVIDLSVDSGDFTLGKVNFEIPGGTYGVLMGRTGSGKTTLLEAICGLRRIRNGHVILHDQDVTPIPPYQRGIGLVPQDKALFSTKTVRQHLEFGPKIQGWATDKIKPRVEQLAEQLNITSILDRKPKGLSGGEQQRVALGRALASPPKVLCLDEPLNALDEGTHTEMIELLKQITSDNPEVTVLHITHSHAEAKEVADCIFQLEQVVSK